MAAAPAKSAFVFLGWAELLAKQKERKRIHRLKFNLEPKEYSFKILELNEKSVLTIKFSE